MLYQCTKMGADNSHYFIYTVDFCMISFEKKDSVVKTI
jgi:hypothetical protein